MPELPEVETVKRTLEHLILHKTIKAVDVTWDNIIYEPSVNEFKKRLCDQSIQSLDRYGKYLILNLDHDILISHLRMEGKFFYYEKAHPRNKHVHVVFKFYDGSELHYHDTRKFGKMNLVSKNIDLFTDGPLKKLGFEPFDPRADADYLSSKLKNRRISVKQALLDQSILVGLGNIYVDEVCFMCALHPATTVDLLTRDDLECIILNAQKVLEKAINLGGTTIRSYQSNVGVTGRFQNELLVHMRKDQACHICKTSIVKGQVAKRGTYYCPHCQKERL